MPDQPLQKSLFWIISTLLLTTVFTSSFMYGIGFFIISFAIPIVILKPIIISLLSNTLYLLSLVIGLKYALSFIKKRTEVSEKEAKIISFFVACSPLLVILFIIFPWQIYYRGVKIAVGLLSQILNKRIFLLIEWVLLGFLSYYWLRKRAASVSSYRKKITKGEMSILILFLVLYWLPPTLFKEDFKNVISPILLTQEEYQRQEEEKEIKMEKFSKAMANWQTTYNIEQIRDVLEKEGGSYSDVDCNHPSIREFCREIEKWTGSKPIIHSSESEYCIYAKLTTGEYICIDTSGIERYTKTNPAGEGYCDGRTFVCPE